MSTSRQIFANSCRRSHLVAALLLATSCSSREAEPAADATRDIVDRETSTQDSEIDAAEDLAEAVQEVEVGAEVTDGDGPPAGCRTPCAYGRLVRDHRSVDAERARLGPVEVVPVVDHEVAVRVAGVEVASGRTDGEGRFALELPESAVAAPELVFSAVERAADGAPSLVIFDGQEVDIPPRPGVEVEVTRPWAWVAAPVDGSPGDFGEVHITSEMGAGALALVTGLKLLRAKAIALFGEVGASDLGLAVMWSPHRTPACLSCYLASGWGPIVWRSATGDVVFEHGIFLSGASPAPHHFTPSIFAHELGHWVMDTYSRFPEVGGTHTWDQVTAPPLAWSEGFATFFGQWALSEGAAESRFFAVQANIHYWIDLEAIGSSPPEPDSSVALAFPLPDPAAGIDQPINEAVVAAILWDLWDDAGEDPVQLGDATLTAIARPRLTGDLDRGAGEPDLVDYLDALSCPPAEPVDFTPVLMGFPWDDAPLCSEPGE